MAFLDNTKMWEDTSAFNIVSKASDSPSDARKDPLSIKYPTEQKKSLKTEIWGLLLEALENSTFDNPVTRSELKAYCKANDRTIRYGITELRKMGYRIGSFSGGKGYWLCKTSEEYQLVRNMYVSKARDMLETVRAMDGHIFGQMEM